MDPKIYMKCYVDNKFGALDNKIGDLEVLIKRNHSELLEAIGVKDNKTEKTDTRGVSSPQMMDDYVEKENVAPQPNSDNFDQQTISLMQMDFATVDTLPVEVGNQKVYE
ncbi:hypothetical protein EJD97_017823 [Solanum chilense]|uniref:Uncharacterized protein n=1 Tax=Solanum chilense TaxID=4083 RepID=A0A6N2AE03_SOLCI|nr:hypothetical protein EJD97_017823 [Solanum chilense]